MAPLIDQMVANGKLTPEQGRFHPDRNCLLSVLLGDNIEKIDCPKTPLKLLEGDIVIVASDGLQYLSDEQITAMLRSREEQSSNEIAFSLLRAVNALNDPDQDNISIAVVKVNRTTKAAEIVPEYRSRRRRMASGQTRLVSFSSHR